MQQAPIPSTFDDPMGYGGPLFAQSTPEYMVTIIIYFVPVLLSLAIVFCFPCWYVLMVCEYWATLDRIRVRTSHTTQW